MMLHSDSNDNWCWAYMCQLDCSIAACSRSSSPFCTRAASCWIQELQQRRFAWSNPNRRMLSQIAHTTSFNLDLFDKLSFPQNQMNTADPSRSYDLVVSIARTHVRNHDPPIDITHAIVHDLRLLTKLSWNELMFSNDNWNDTLSLLHFRLLSPAVVFRFEQNNFRLDSIRMLQPISSIETAWNDDRDLCCGQRI